MRKYPHAIVIVTLACNLKCQNCILCSPYYKKPFHPSTEFIEETAERAFRLGDYDIFEYMGGEPLLREDFPAASRSPTRWWRSGGTTARKSTSSWTTTGRSSPPWRRRMWKNSAGTGLTASSGTCTAKNGISAAGWTSWPRRSPSGTWRTPSGLLMPCHMQFQLNDRGIVDAKAPEFEGQCIDLFDDTESWERKREKMDTYTDVSRLPYLESCRYCKCLAEDTPRLKPAVQAESLEALPFRMEKSKGVR